MPGWKPCTRSRCLPQAEADWEVARGELMQRASEAERRAQALAEQRDVLQQQLEKAAAEAPGEGARAAQLCALRARPTASWRSCCVPCWLIARVWL